MSTIPRIAPQWLIDSPGNALYARVAEDKPTLNLLRDILMKGRMEMSDFQPSLAFVVTWHSSESENVSWLPKLRGGLVSLEEHKLLW